ncbi:MAG: RNA 2',3'-cyclic phosphodiesterase [Bacteroidales bacterium]|nr:RNA 2',3'-cyclic phosphodiesterase [Bacteroidales bacterium]MCF8389274.1 RNA 2',3'-cyclic phosphodiesterase [Bacteroidales bacterium]
MSYNQNIHRLFIGLKIYPDSIFNSLREGIRQKLHKEKIRWVKPEHLHLTIRFLGDTDSNQISLISRQLGEVASETKCFNVSIKALGVFRSFSHPKVLWAGVEQSDPLIELKNKVDNALNEMDYQFCSDNYSPHLTLGRMKNIINKVEFRDIIVKNNETLFLQQNVKSMVLFESILKNDGSEYIPVSEHFFL